MELVYANRMQNDGFDELCDEFEEWCVGKDGKLKREVGDMGVVFDEWAGRSAVRWFRKDLETVPPPHFVAAAS